MQIETYIIQAFLHQVIVHDKYYTKNEQPLSAGGASSYSWTIWSFSAASWSSSAQNLQTFWIHSSPCWARGGSGERLARAEVLSSRSLLSLERISTMGWIFSSFFSLLSSTERWRWSRKAQRLVHWIQKRVEFWAQKCHKSDSGSKWFS